MWNKKKPGISVLISSQNEEAIISLCIRSFLNFGDEIIVVDNGSTDRTKEIVIQLQQRYPSIIKFYDKPELIDLFQNRQFAYEQSSYEWIMRGDADYVAYTNGPYDIQAFRDMLLARPRSLRPEGIYVPHYNTLCDFWHTGKEEKEGNLCVTSPPMLRFYRNFPFFKFVRRGKWEGARFQNMLKKIVWNQPLWMHCILKSDINILYRSERTNWRELGDYEQYPTLEDYLHVVIPKKYGTTDLNEAAGIFMEQRIYPLLKPYDPEKYFPYPELVREQMEKNPIYRIIQEEGRITRRFFGVDEQACE